MKLDMIPNLSLEKAHLIKEKIEEIKKVLDLDVFTYTSNETSVTMSVLGNIKNISNHRNISIEELIPIINEASSKARQDYEVKQAHLLQKEMMDLM